jgi:hypothetical protein
MILIRHYAIITLSFSTLSLLLILFDIADSFLSLADAFASYFRFHIEPLFSALAIFSIIFDAITAFAIDFRHFTPYFQRLRHFIDDSAIATMPLSIFRH